MSRNAQRFNGYHCTVDWLEKETMERAERLIPFPTPPPYRDTSEQRRQTWDALKGFVILVGLSVAIAGGLSHAEQSAKKRNAQTIMTDGSGTFAWSDSAGKLTIGAGSSSTGTLTLHEGTGITTRVSDQLVGKVSDDTLARSSKILRIGTPTSRGTLRLSDGGSGYVAIAAPALSSNYTITWPTGPPPHDGCVLLFDKDGHGYWSDQRFFNRIHPGGTTSHQGASK